MDCAPVHSRWLSPAHALARRRTLAWTDIAGERLFMTKSSNYLRLRATLGKGVDLVDVQESTTATAGLAMASSQANELGFMCAPLGDETRAQFKIEPSRKGLVVTEVQSGSPAADAGLMIGDVLASVQLQPVAQPEEIAAAIGIAAKAKRDYIAMLVESQGRLKYLALPLKWQAPPDQVAGGAAK